jgi:hypothetical protein
LNVTLAVDLGGGTAPRQKDRKERKREGERERDRGEEGEEEEGRKAGRGYERAVSKFSGTVAGVHRNDGMEPVVTVIRVVGVVLNMGKSHGIVIMYMQIAGERNTDEQDVTVNIRPARLPRTVASARAHDPIYRPYRSIDRSIDPRMNFPRQPIVDDIPSSLLVMPLFSPFVLSAFIFFLFLQVRHNQIRSLETRDTLIAEIRRIFCRSGRSGRRVDDDARLLESFSSE